MALRFVKRVDPNFESVTRIAPGHFYSPLLDLSELDSSGNHVFDTEQLWEHAGIDEVALRSSYRELAESFPDPKFPIKKCETALYFSDNDYFYAADAYVLSAILRRFQPRRIIEVGSGFSSAAMIDTCEQSNLKAEITFIEPFPDRLNQLTEAHPSSMKSLVQARVQEVDFSVFEQLEANDVCFIDSSHVAKIGSDVSWLFLNVIPKLKPGVLIHIHDIFYPHSYPGQWVIRGRAWNESLFLRAYLCGQNDVEILAFNSWAEKNCSELFPEGILKTQDFNASFWFRHKA